MQPDDIKIFGEHEDSTLAQIKRCASNDAVRGAVLCADGHLGYAVPIGGVVAYEDKISPSGVGFDIACLAAGTRVTTSDGYWLPIEAVSANEPLPCWDGGQVRRITEHIGSVKRPTKTVLRVKLANGRGLLVTGDHLILTKEGWKRADAVAVGEKIACQPFLGLPNTGHQRGGGHVTVPLLRENGLQASHREALAGRGLYPLTLVSPTLPPLLRLLGALCGDGHLTKDGKRISIYTTHEEDAEAMRCDFARLGYEARIARRKRYETRQGEIQVYVTSTALHALCGQLGAPVGKKDWPAAPMPWLFRLPAWARAQYLSGFCSAEALTPRVACNSIPNLAVKQTGSNQNAIRFVARLFESLCFDVSMAPSGPARSDRRDYVLQVLGGAAEQVRFYEEVGFCYAAEKRRRAAQAASVTWSLASHTRGREQAREEALALRQAGLRYKDVIAQIIAKYGVSYGFVFHALYARRGPNRRERGLKIVPDTVGEICWVPVESIEEGGEAPVYDVVTGDAAHCFFAEGVVVHNCGNKAVLTDAPAAEVRANIKTLMDDVWSNLSFGIGRNNETRVDHELFDDPAWKLQPVKSIKQMAQNQLGTIGSGNHYVDLFADEQDRVWIGVHFGSRGLGHKTATYFLQQGGAKDGMDVDPLVIDVNSAMGSDYLACMQLAGRYAYAGRDWVCSEVARILGATVLEEVHNHHNFCIPATEKVPTPIGYKRMGDLAVGDTVYAYDLVKGLVETSVTQKWHSGRKHIYTIRTSNRSIRVSGDHPLLVIEVERKPHPQRPWFDKREGNYVWKRANEIKVGDVVVCAQGYYAEDQPIGEDLARFIGAYLGDGWLRHSKPEVSGYSVGLAVGAAGEAHTGRYAVLCERLYPDVEWHNNAPGAFGLTCSSKRVHQSLQTLDLSHKSEAKHLPAFVFSLPKNEKMALLAGYFDADGSVASGRTSNYGRGTIASVSKELVEGLREIAISCHLRVTPVREEHRHTNFGPCRVYRCAVSAGSMKELDLWHDGKAACQRAVSVESHGLLAKKLGYLELPENFLGQRVRGICVSEAEEDVYDIAVAHDSHSFICEGVVVHNCWIERHGGRDLWVVRKGATPAFPGQKGFVGGSMGDQSVILEGVESEEAKDSLYSTVHGAGRVMSRTAARGKINRKTGQIVSPGRVSREMMMDWIRAQKVELRGAGTDESPQCYKRLPEVLAHHRHSIRILHTLTPLGVAMAGEEIVDPYKD